MKRTVTINTTQKQEQLLDYLCRYHGTTSESKLLSILLEEKLKEEIEKNRKDLDEFYGNNIIPRGF